MSGDRAFVLFDSLLFPSDQPRVVVVGPAEEKLAPFQTIIWISIWPNIADFYPQDQIGVDPIRLPAILDTGFSGTFAISEEQLRLTDVMRKPLRWSPDNARRMRDASGRVSLIPTLQADLRLHAENPQPGAPATWRLPLGNTGINVYTSERPLIGTHIAWELWHSFSNKMQEEPKAVRGPPLPIIGLRALSAGNLKIETTCGIKQGVDLRLWIPADKTYFHDQTDESTNSITS